MTTDPLFTGLVPRLSNQRFGPILFEPYAAANVAYWRPCHGEVPQALALPQVVASPDAHISPCLRQPRRGDLSCLQQRARAAMGLCLVAIGLSGAISAEPTLAQETEGDPEAGRQVAGTCQACHGMDGYARIPIAPHIGGEPAAYLAEQLRAYRSGQREHAMMSRVANSLTDEQIDDVAAWYVSYTAAAVPPEDYDAAAAPLFCMGCHGADGIAPTDGYPHLAGDARVYTETQLKAYRSGEREHAMMTPIAQRLSDEELSEVADWFASIGLELSGP